MAEDKDRVAMPSVREKLADLLGLDPSRVDNDEALYGAFVEFIDEQEERITKRAKAMNAEEAERLRTAAEQAFDFARAADEVRARAEDRRQQRAMNAAQDPARKGTENIEEALRAESDIIAAVRAAEAPMFKGLSGVMELARAEPPSLKRLLQRPVAEDSPIRLLQRAHDDMVTLRAALQVGGSNTRYPALEALSSYQRWHGVFERLSKALSTSDASAWTPTYYSTLMVENVYQKTDVAGLFLRRPWLGPGGTATIPVEGTDLTMYGVGEATTDDDDSPYTASEIGVGTSITVTARTMAVRTVWSYEMEEDSIIDLLPHIQEKFARAFARDLDQAILDGDADSSHQDTGLTLDANDNRRLFNGLRKKALADTMTSAATYFNAEIFATPLLLMGAYGQPATSTNLPADGTVGICSWGTLLKMGFLRDTQNQRIAGANAPIVGPMQSFMGYPLHGAAKVRSDVNASGIYDGSTTDYTYLLWVFIPAWQFHVKSELEVSVFDRREYGQRGMVGRQRMAFTHVYPSSAKTTLMVYAFKDTAF